MLYRGLLAEKSRMRIVKLLSRIFLLLLLLALAAYAGYYYQVKSSVDRQLQQWRPFLDASYDVLYVNPLGEISLNTVSLNLMGQPGGFIIDRISLKSDPLFLLQFDSRSRRGEWPDSLALAVEGFNVDFSMPLFLMLEQFTQSAEGVQPAALGCGRVRHFDMSALRMMGMRQGRFDFYLNARSPASAQLNLELLALMHGWGELVIDLEMQNVTNMQVLTNVAPQLRRLAVSYRDMGYNQRKNQFCAMQSGVTVAEYRSEHQVLLRDWLSEAAPELPDSFVVAYDQLNEPNATFSMSLQAEGVSPQSWMDPEQLLLDLSQRMTIHVNNQPQLLEAEQLGLFMALMQQPVQFEVEPMEESDAVATLDAPRSMPGVASPPVQPSRAIEPRRYRHTPPDELVNYIGHPVRFFTSFGKRVEGVLVSVEGTTVRVAERVQHGTAQYPVEIEALQATEVYR